jgi:hypothetical protein
MSSRLISSSLLAVVLASLFISTAAAQQRRNPAAMQQPQLRPFSKDGALILTSQNTMQISAGGTDTIYVRLMPNTQVSVTGTAEQDYLKSGVTVEFQAEIDKAHTVKEKILRLCVVTATTDHPVGLFPPDFSIPDKKDKKGGKGDSADNDKPKPGGPDPGIADAPAKGRKSRAKKDADPFAADPLAGKQGKAQSSAPQFPGTFTVRGTIKSCKDGKITVAAGRSATIKAELASDVTIDVNMSDARVAQRDDKVKVSGVCNPANPNMVMAETIKIELANPLSGAKKRATRPERPTKTPAAHPPKAKKGAADSDDLLGGGK